MAKDESPSDLAPKIIALILLVLSLLIGVAIFVIFGLKSIARR